MTAIDCRDGRIRGVEVANLRAPGERHRVEGDWYVSALPVEVMATLVTPAMLEADPGLAGIQVLAENVRWMNGIQFFLRENVDLVHGHALYVDSPWAITSISQAQFWPDIRLENYGDGTVQGILSVDISDWSTPGLFVPQPAWEVEQRDDIAREVWEELKLGLNVDGRQVLRDDMRHSYFLDPAIMSPLADRSRRWMNLEPLFINAPDTWRLRPPATSAIPNLFLASDYVQTNTDLACMEAANEAARRAVNAILQAADSAERPCRIWPMGMPPIFAPLRLYDQWRFERGEPWKGELTL